MMVRLENTTAWPGRRAGFQSPWQRPGDCDTKTPTLSRWSDPAWAALQVAPPGRDLTVTAALPGRASSVLGAAATVTGLHCDSARGLGLRLAAAKSFQAAASLTGVMPGPARVSGFRFAWLRLISERLDLEKEIVILPMNRRTNRNEPG